MFRWYLNYVSWVLFWSCFGDVSVVIWSWIRLISVIFRWFINYISFRIYFYLFLDDIAAWFWYYHVLISVMSRACSGDFSAMSWLCLGHISGISRWYLSWFCLCFASVLFLFLLVMSRSCLLVFGYILGIFYDFLGRACFGEISVKFGDGIKIFW